MNKFLAAVKRQIGVNGIVAKITKVTEGVFDPETLTAANTEVNYSVLLFKRHIEATQYNFPNLVGKDAAEFYLANDSLPFKPEPKDKITYAGDTFTVNSVKENWAGGLLCMYQIIGVKN